LGQGRKKNRSVKGVLFSHKTLGSETEKGAAEAGPRQRAPITPTSWGLEKRVEQALNGRGKMGLMTRDLTTLKGESHPWTGGFHLSKQVRTRERVRVGQVLVEVTTSP